MHAVISAFIIILISCSISYAHNGVDHGDGGSHDAPKGIENGKLEGQDHITYLDAGADIQWAGQKLKRKITDTNQVVYQYIGEVKEALSATEAQNNFLEIKIPGGQVLKTFSFNHAGESNEPLEILTPDFSRSVEISKHQDFKISWKPRAKTELTSAMIKIIIEVRTASNVLKGRLTLSTSDDGEFNIPVNLLSQLPEGSAKIAIKRIWLGGFHPFADKTQMLGVKTVVSVVGKAKVVAE
ncbi:MAG: hypothetical protein AABY53_06325 [Bdellovibrionota bacterium]